MCVLLPLVFGCLLGITRMIGNTEMNVAELIVKLQAMPQSAEVRVQNVRMEWVDPQPEQVWDDHAEIYLVVL